MIARLERGTVDFVRLSRIYAARSGTCPAPLDAYPSLEALLAALGGRGQADAGTRRRLLCAIIAEHQRSPGPWTAAVALHAFRGMLILLSRSLLGVDDRDEADALVVAGLLEALGRVRPGRDPDRIGMYVRQETRRAVFAALGRDADAREYQDKPDEDEILAREARAASEPQDGEVEEEDLDADDTGDDASGEEPLRDPFARERASRKRVPDQIADPDSLAPIEDHILLARPTVDGVPEETLLMAHAQRGGVRRLAQFLFADAGPVERRRMAQRLAARARALTASK